jgi:hypothetical protein
MGFRKMVFQFLSRFDDRVVYNIGGPTGDAEQISI